MTEPIAVYLAGGQNDRVLKVMYPPFMSDPRFNTVGVSNNWNDLTARFVPGAAEILVVEADIAPDPDTLMRFLNTLPSPAIVVLPGNASALEGKIRNIQATVRDVYVGPAVNYQEVARKAPDRVVPERSLRQFAEPTRGLIGGGPRTATIVGTRIIAVWGKGGSGKSTLATNLAWELARRGLRTVAIGLGVPDALVAYLNIEKIQTASMAFFQRPNLEGFRASITRKDNLDVVISPNDILIAEEMARRPSDDPGSIKSLVMTAANDGYAAVILDLPGERTEWAVQPLIAANTVLLVAQPSFIDLQRVVDLYRMLTEKLAGQHRVADDAIYLVMNEVSDKDNILPRDFQRAAMDFLKRQFPPAIGGIPLDPAGRPRATRGARR